MSNMVVATNVKALNSHRALKGVGSKQSRSAARLSSGYRINSAADDAAGLAISEKMRAQIRGLDQASRNSQDAISLIQTAEGGMQEIDNMIQRIRELTVQAANDTNENNRAGTGDRQKIQDEINQLVAEIDSMAGRVEFNRKRLISGDFAVPQELVDMRRMQLNAANEQIAVSTINRSETLQTLRAARTELNRFEGNVDNEFNFLIAAYEQVKTQEHRQAVNDFNNAADALRNMLVSFGVPEEVLSDIPARDNLYWHGVDAERAPSLLSLNFINAPPNPPEDFDVWIGPNQNSISIRLNGQTFTESRHSTFGIDAFERLMDAHAELVNAEEVLLPLLSPPSLVGGGGLDDAIIQIANGAINAANNLHSIIFNNMLTFNGLTNPPTTIAEAQTMIATVNGLPLETTITGVINQLTRARNLAQSFYDASGFQCFADFVLETNNLISQMSSLSGQVTALQQAVRGDFALGGTAPPTMPNASTISPGHTNITNPGVVLNGAGLAGTVVQRDASDAHSNHFFGLLSTTFNSPINQLINVDTGIPIETPVAGGDRDVLYSMLPITVTAIPTLDAHTGYLEYNFGALGVFRATFVGGALTIHQDADITRERLEFFRQHTSNYNAAVAALATGTLQAQVNTAMDNLNTTIGDIAADIASLETARDAMVECIEENPGLFEAEEGSLRAALNNFEEAMYVFANLDPTCPDNPVNRRFQAYQVALNKLLVADFLGEHIFTTWPERTAGWPQVNDPQLPSGQEGILELARQLQRAKIGFINMPAERQHIDLSNRLQTAKSGHEVTTLNLNIALSSLDRSTLALIEAQKIASENNANPLYFQVGANAHQGIDMSIGSIKSNILGIGDGLGNTNIDVVRNSGRDITGILNVLDEALSYVSTERSKLGAAQNRMEHTIRSLDISSVNLSASESRIRDADMAREMMAFTQANVLHQAAISMLAQANQAPQALLQLLG